MVSATKRFFLWSDPFERSLTISVDALLRHYGSYPLGGGSLVRSFALVT